MSENVIVIPVRRDRPASRIQFLFKSSPILFPKLAECISLSVCCPAHVLEIRNDKTRVVLDRVRYTRRDIAPTLRAGTLIAK